MARVVIENVCKSFPVEGGGHVCAVKDLSLTVESGEMLVMVGPSGCGKTTTLRLLAGLETPDSGTISLDGRPLNGLAPRERDVAMVFQSHALFPHLTAYENLAFGLMLRKVPKAEIAQRVSAAAETLGLAGLLDRKPQALLALLAYTQTLQACQYAEHAQ